MSESTPEPSASALAAVQKIADGCCYQAWNGMNYYSTVKEETAARIIDAEFAALRAKLKSANEVISYYADCDALTSQQRERAFSFLNYS